MITAILIDDEKDAIESLLWEIKTFCKDIEILDTFTDPEEAISAINYLKPDAVFLDIEMPKMDGFQLLSNLTFRKFDLIITTAYDDYALKAFKADAIDYLLKPIDNDDLVKAVKKIKKNKSDQNLGKALEGIVSSQQRRDKKVAIPMSGKVVFVSINDVYYCKSDGNYTTVYLVSGEKYLVSKKIKDVLHLFDSEKIMRVHQSYLVNLDYIKEYIKNEGFYLILTKGNSVPVSRPNRNIILEAISNS